MRMTAHGRYAFGALAALALAVLAAPTAWAQVGNTDTASSSVDATVITALTLSNTAGLDFGDFTPGTNGGTIVVATDGSSEAFGDVSVVADSPQAAAFGVTGESGKVYDISLPGSATLSGPGADMTADTFVANSASDGPGLTGTVTSGVDTIAVGATLHVAGVATQTSGDYTGSFNVTITYQ